MLVKCEVALIRIIFAPGQRTEKSTNEEVSGD